MKKIIMLLVAFIMSAVMCSCAADENKDTTFQSTSETISTTAATTESESDTNTSETISTTATTAENTINAYNANPEDYIEIDFIIERSQLEIDENELNAAVSQRALEEYNNLKKNRFGTRSFTKNAVAKNYDRVIISSYGVCNGRVMDNADNRTVEIGSNTMIPGYESGIIGTPIGESVTFDVVCPSNYPPEYANKTATFTIKVKQIIRTYPSEYNDKFIYLATDFNTVAEFEDSIRADIIEGITLEQQDTIKAEIFSRILNNSEFKTDVSGENLTPEQLKEILVIRYIAIENDIVLEEEETFSDLKNKVIDFLYLMYTSEE